MDLRPKPVLYPIFHRRGFMLPSVYNQPQPAQSVHQHEIGLFQSSYIFILKAKHDVLGTRRNSVIDCG